MAEDSFSMREKGHKERGSYLKKQSDDILVQPPVKGENDVELVDVTFNNKPVDNS